MRRRRFAAGAPDEPADCACFCQNWYCRGDEDRRVLEACELAAPCDLLLVVPRLGAADHEAERCVLEHVRDRVPGLYEVFLSTGVDGTSTRLYVVGEQAWRIRQVPEEIESCPKVSDWTRAELCTLAPTEYFATCLEVSEPGEDCVLHLDAWLHDCVEQPPSCE
ncbi:MAG TPA: hypothetical protein VG755_04945 [Nannocystaceae bacterium]|nr:hypothetical protein [Nannocystaceae bacterium]